MTLVTIYAHFSLVTSQTNHDVGDICLSSKSRQEAHTFAQNDNADNSYSIALPANSIYLPSVLNSLSLSPNFEIDYPDEYAYSTIHTPNKSPVRVKEYTSDYSTTEKDKMDTDCDTSYPDATRLASSSRIYNCHSYAWYQQSIDNPFWMDNPSAYYLDGSYVESIGLPGDIICYFDNGNYNTHSGVVKAKNPGSSNGVLGDASLYTIVSKWGRNGLYEHAGDYCPYSPVHGGFASYIKFYRTPNTPHNHAYNYSYSWVNYNQHRVYCACGSYIQQAHAVSSGSIGGGQQYATCLLCHGSASIGILPFGLSIFSVTITNGAITIKSSFGNGSFILSNGVVVLSDSDLSLFLSGDLDINDFAN